MFRGSTYRLCGYLILLIATVAGIALSVVYQKWTLLLLVLPVFIFALVAILRLYFQSIRKMTFMFNSIENNDYAFKFTEYNGPVSDNLLNMSLNRIRDIMVKAKTEVVEKERYYELILNSVNTGVIVLSDAGSVYQINDEALRLVGLPRFTHVNQLSVIDPSLKDLFAMLKAGEKKQATYSNERGTIHLAVNVSGVTIRGTGFRIVAISDINNELDEKETESWIRLIRVLTHEIMNTITPITSLSDTLLRLADSSSPEIREGLEVINSSGKGLINFVESYRQLTRIPTPNPTSFYLKPFLERIARLTEAQDLQNQPKITISVEPADLLLYADEDLIGQVVLNLMKNAAHAVESKPEGEITVTACGAPAGQIIVEVSDNGDGIPAEIADSIFIPFFTTKQNGSGIGLSVSRQIMRMHNGSISVKCSRYGKTTFALLFI